MDAMLINNIVGFLGIVIWCIGWHKQNDKMLCSANILMLSFATMALIITPFTGWSIINILLIVLTSINIKIYITKSNNE